MRFSLAAMQIHQIRESVIFLACLQTPQFFYMYRLHIPYYLGQVDITFLKIIIIGIGRVH